MRASCRWAANGKPQRVHHRPAQLYEGTDRQARGRLLAVLRSRHEPVARATLDAAWPDAAQRARALGGLIADGLVEAVDGGRYRLPA